jgi:predicted DNA binding CopG/RHH family protein
MMERAQTHPISKMASNFASATVKRQSQKSSSPRITLRLTDEELAKLKMAAEGVSVSSYIRKKLFGNDVSLRKTRNRVPVRNQEALAQVLGKLGQTRIANNLNQIAYEANCGSLLMDKETEDEIKLACAQIAWIRVKLIEALGLKNKNK